jgi:hypothetical protein
VRQNMQRRDFLSSSLKMPLTILGLGLISGRSLNSAFACESDFAAKQGIKTFAFYQGLGPIQVRSPNRTDGTNFSMPCISEDDVTAGEAKSYEFWHGHGGKNHKFTIDADGFSKLAAGESIEIFTDVVTGHRHALKIDPSLKCTIR